MMLQEHLKSLFGFWNILNKVSSSVGSVYLLTIQTNWDCWQIKDTTASASLPRLPFFFTSCFLWVWEKRKNQHQICVGQEFEFPVAETLSLTSGLVVSDPERESAARPVFTRRDQRFRPSWLKHAGKVRDPFDLLWRGKRMTCWWCSWSANGPSEAHRTSLGWHPDDIKAFPARFHSGTSPTKNSESHGMKVEEPDWGKIHQLGHNKYWWLLCWLNFWTN